MIENIVYIAALMAPELAGVVSDGAGSLVEKTGRRLAVGLCDELEARMKASSSSVIRSLIDARSCGANGLADTLKTLAEPALTKTLDAEGVTVANKEELGLLRELAAQVATGADTSETLAKLKAYLAKQAPG